MVFYSGHSLKFFFLICNNVAYFFSLLNDAETLYMFFFPSCTFYFFLHCSKLLMHVWRQFCTYFTTLLRFMCSSHIYFFFFVFVYLSVFISKPMNIIALNASRQPINWRRNGIGCSTRVNSSSLICYRHFYLIHSFCTNAILFIDDFISLMKTKWFLFMQCCDGRERKKWFRHILLSFFSLFLYPFCYCSKCDAHWNHLIQHFLFCFKHSFQFQRADFLHYTQP